jgi:hypothetical protein
MEHHNSILPAPKRTPWNKGKLIGAKPPLLARHVWSIRTKLQIERRRERQLTVPRFHDQSSSIGSSVQYDGSVSTSGR